MTTHAAPQVADEARSPDGFMPVPEEWTPEQMAEFQERWNAAAAAPPKPVWLGSRSLTADEMRQLLRECVTVVKPGETLVLRTASMNPERVGQYQRWLDVMHDAGHLPFRAVVVYGDSLGIQEGDDR